MASPFLTATYSQTEIRRRREEERNKEKEKDRKLQSSESVSNPGFVRVLENLESA